MLPLASRPAGAPRPIGAPPAPRRRATARRTGRHPIPTIRSLAGGAHVVERWQGPDAVQLSLVDPAGVVPFRELVDVLTALILLGARHIDLDVTDADVGRPAARAAIEQTRRFLARIDGSLRVGHRAAPASHDPHTDVDPHTRPGPQTRPDPERT